MTEAEAGSRRRVVLQVVPDTVVLYQAFLSRNGPAAALLDAAYAGRVELVVSETLLGELRETCLKPKLLSKRGYTADQVELFVDEIHELAILVAVVPSVFEYPRDPDDAHLIDLAIAAGATLITTRDRDLLDLMDQGRSEGRDFRRQYPTLEVLPPEQVVKSGAGDVSEPGCRAPQHAIAVRRSPRNAQASTPVSTRLRGRGHINHRRPSNPRT